MTDAITRPEPNFFVVGASRAGTTSLWQFLRQHPDVLMPSSRKTKEPSHFAEPCPTWARKFRDRDTYLDLFKDGVGKKAIGEASPAYLASTGCAQRIFNSYPNARIIVTLRQPARRAFSLYRFMCMWGFEWLPTFEQALEAEEKRAFDHELKRKRPFWFDAYLYFRFSLYSNQVKQYLDVFPREQVHVLLFEDLKRRPVETTQEIFKFLGVDPSFTPDVTPMNESLVPASIRAQHMIAERWRKHPLSPGENPRFIDWWVFPLLAGGNMVAGRWRKTLLKPETERRLLERYRSDINATAELIGRSLDAWLEPRVASNRAA